MADYKNILVWVSFSLPYTRTLTKGVYILL